MLITLPLIFPSPILPAYSVVAELFSAVRDKKVVLQGVLFVRVFNIHVRLKVLTCATDKSVKHRERYKWWYANKGRTREPGSLYVCTMTLWHYHYHWCYLHGNKKIHIYYIFNVSSEASRNEINYKMQIDVCIQDTEQNRNTGMEWKYEIQSQYVRIIQ